MRRTGRIVPATVEQQAAGGRVPNSTAEDVGCRPDHFGEHACRETLEAIVNGSTGPAGETPDERIRHRLKALFAATDDEAAVEAVISDRGRELEEQTERLRQTIESLERREEQAARLRSAVEEMLRHGSAELDERQAELAALAIELRAREEAVREQERDVALRKQELGAVELRRAAVERREETAAEREAALEQAASISAPASCSSPSESAHVPSGGDLPSHPIRSPRRRRTCSTSRATAGGSSSATARAPRSMPPSRWTESRSSSRGSDAHRSPATGGPASTSSLPRTAAQRPYAASETGRRRLGLGDSPSASIRRPA